MYTTAYFCIAASTYCQKKVCASITHSFVIFGVNHPEDSFYYEDRKFVPNISTLLRSDDVIVTSSKTTLSRTASTEKIQQYSV